MASFLIKAGWFGWAAPAQPGAVTPTDDPGVSVTLNWADNSDIDLDHYDIRVKRPGGVRFTRLAQPKVSTYVDTAAGVGVNTYRIYAVDVTNHSSLLREVTQDHADTPEEP